MPKTLEIGPSDISKALADASFFRTVPEFSQLQAKIDTMKITKKPGCSSCRMRRIVSSIQSDFLRLLPTLTEDGKARLRKYFGVDEIKYNKVDRIARKTYTVSL